MPAWFGCDCWQCEEARFEEELYDDFEDDDDDLFDYSLEDEWLDCETCEGCGDCACYADCSCFAFGDDDDDF